MISEGNDESQYSGGCQKTKMAERVGADSILDQVNSPTSAQQVSSAEHTLETGRENNQLEEPICAFDESSDGTWIEEETVVCQLCS